MLARDYAQYGRAKAGGDRCDECRWFTGAACEIVEGKIAAGGWCRFFHEKKGNMAGKQDSDRAYVRQMRAA